MFNKKFWLLKAVFTLSISIDTGIEAFTLVQDPLIFDTRVVVNSNAWYECCNLSTPNIITDAGMSASIDTWKECIELKYWTELLSSSQFSDLNTKITEVPSGCFRTIDLRMYFMNVIYQKSAVQSESDIKYLKNVRQKDFLKISRSWFFPNNSLPAHKSRKSRRTCRLEKVIWRLLQLENKSQTFPSVSILSHNIWQIIFRTIHYQLTRAESHVALVV